MCFFKRINIIVSFLLCSVFLQERSICLAEQFGFSFGTSVCLAWQPGRQGQRAPHVFVLGRITCVCSMFFTIVSFPEDHQSTILANKFHVWSENWYFLPGSLAAKARGSRILDIHVFESIAFFELFSSGELELSQRASTFWQTNLDVLRVFLAWQPCRQG